MVKRYGEDATTEAAKHADELLAEEDLKGCAIWRRITEAVEQLLTTEPGGKVN